MKRSGIVLSVIVISFLFTGLLTNAIGSEGNSPVRTVLTNCTVIGNSSSGQGGGVYNDGEHLRVQSCILWGNAHTGPMDESAQLYGKTPEVTFSCIQDDNPSDGDVPFGDSNSGNIDDDPSFEDPSRMARIAGPFTNLSCWYSIFSLVPIRIAANRPPENVLKIVKTTTIFIISRILNNLSHCLGPDFIKQRIGKIHNQDGKNNAINVCPDIPYEYGQNPPPDTVNHHGDGVDR